MRWPLLKTTQHSEGRSGGDAGRRAGFNPFGEGGFFTTFQGKMMLWQIPLIIIFALDPGPFVAAFWLFGYVLLALKRWWLSYPLMMVAFAILFMVERPPSAEFFIGMMVLILPMSWRPEEEGQVISPVGLTPTIFLVGSVFIFHIQFFILLLVFIWLLGFLMWFSMTYAGWQLKDLRIRWGMMLATAIGGSSLVVLIFALVPKIDTGAIPSFARAPDKVKLTDELSADGFRSLLGDDTVAFRAFPEDGSTKIMPYWRVFTLDFQSEKGWSRSNRPRSRVTTVGRLEANHRIFEIMSEGHDLKWIPIPGWPVPGVHPKNRVTSFAEVAAPTSTLRQAHVAVYDQTVGVTDDVRRWEGSTILYSEGRLARWARDERAKFNSDLSFAQYLITYFNANFTYSTTTSYSSSDSDTALDEFFFDGQSGYCSFYAQAMATALRAIGVPAHVVTGYFGGEWNEFGGYWMVKNNMAHAWVEAYFPETGWRRFDPTVAVADSQGGLRGSVLLTGEGPEETQAQDPDRSVRPGFFAQTGLWFDSLNTNITRSIMTFGGGNNRSFRSRIAGMDFETLLWILGGFMVSIVVFSGGTVFIRRLGYLGGKPGLKLEQDLTALLTQRRGPRLAGEGLMAYSRRLVHEDAVTTGSDIGGDMLGLARAITRIRFGADVPQPEQLKALRQMMKDLARGLKKQS